MRQEVADTDHGLINMEAMHQLEAFARNSTFLLPLPKRRVDQGFSSFSTTFWEGWFAIRLFYDAHTVVGVKRTLQVTAVGCYWFTVAACCC